LPFYPSPNRDNGFDVADYYGVDDRHGTLGDFVEFVREADPIREVLDLLAPAPVLDGDDDRIRMAYGLLFSLPGTPLFVYGDEVGMGDDLDLPGRTAVRTPMQWSDEENAGFSTADPESLVRPVVSGGEYGYESVNVADQRGDPDSLLQWFSRLTRLRAECPEIGRGDCEILDADDPAVFAHRTTSDHGAAVAVHNLDEAATTATLDLSGEPTRLFGEATFERVPDGDEAAAESDAADDETDRDRSNEEISVDNTDGESDEEYEDEVGARRFELDRYGFCRVRVERGL
jgi:glycosidase